MAISKNNVQFVYIKLGTKCNLHCKYCHSHYKAIDFNPEILPILKSMHLKQITFGGGEPLLYWSTIKQIVEYVGYDTAYKIVSNGTLFTQDIVDFCNHYNFMICISFDGINSMRDQNCPIKWDLISQLNNTGIVVTVYKENQNIEETLNSLNDIKKRYLSITSDKFSSYPHFIHSTKNTGILSSHGLANSYVKQMTELLQESFVEFKKGNATPFLKKCFEDFCYIKPYTGIHCCRNIHIPILANGDIVLCPYDYDKIGDIFHLNEIDWCKIEQENIRKQCKTCSIFNICKNFCCKNITDDECFIMKQMHTNMVNLMKKYDISYSDLVKYIQW